MKNENIPHNQIDVEENCCSSNHSDNHKNKNKYKIYIPAIISFVMLISGIVMDYIEPSFFKDWFRIGWYVVAYIPVGFPVIKQGWENIIKGDFFTEFF